jgi:hypothetical protein
MGHTPAVVVQAGVMGVIVAEVGALSTLRNGPPQERQAHR